MWTEEREGGRSTVFLFHHNRTSSSGHFFITWEEEEEQEEEKGGGRVDVVDRGRNPLLAFQELLKPKSCLIHLLQKKKKFDSFKIRRNSFGRRRGGRQKEKVA